MSDLPGIVSAASSSSNTSLELHQQQFIDEEKANSHQQQATKHHRAGSTIGCPYAALVTSQLATSSSSNSSSSLNNDNGNNDTNNTSNHHENVLPSSWQDLSSMVKDCPAFRNGSCPFKDYAMNATAATATKSTEETKTTISDAKGHHHSHQREVQIGNHHDIRKTLLQIPSSHYQNQQHQFYQMIQQFHQTFESLQSQQHQSDTRLSSLLSSNCETSSALPHYTHEGATNRPSAISCPVANLFMVHVANSNTQSDDRSDQQISAVASTNATQINMIKDVASMKFTEAVEHYSLASIMSRMASSNFDDDEEESDDRQDSKMTVDDTDVSNDRGNSRMTGDEDHYNEVHAVDMEEAQTSKDRTTATGPTSSSRSEQEEKDDDNEVHASSSMLLSECFKIGTIDSHQEAEDVYFVKQFICGNIDQELYKDLLIQLFYVYNALEYYLIDRLHQQTSSSLSLECLQSFLPYHQKLARKQSLVDDLDFWLGTNVMERIVEDGNKSNLDYKNYGPCYKQSIACYEYVQRLHESAHTKPILLIAHSYTRYLGDLSGGKILARVAKKALRLQSSNGIVDGLAFYDFASTIPSAKRFKDEYKNILNTLPSLVLLLSSTHEGTITTSKQHRYDEMILIHQLVSEANIAFVLNIRLFEELDVKAGIPGCAVRSYNGSIAKYTIDYDTFMLHQHSTAASKCPFASLSSGSNKIGHYSKTNVARLNKENSNNKNNGTAVMTKSDDTNENKQLCPFAKISSNPSGGGAHVKSNSVHGDDQAMITKVTTRNANDSSSHHKTRCPWPFIFAHDPKQGLRDWQTWALIGCLLSYSWYLLERK